MLPNNITHNREIALHQGAVLVGGRGDLEIAIPVKDQPCPAGAEALDTSIVKCSFELIERTKGRIDRISQVTAGLAATIWRHDLPEHAVIGMATTIVTHSRANILRQFIEALDQLLDWERGELRVTLYGSVQIVYVRCMVLVMMQLHSLGIDVRL